MSTLQTVFAVTAAVAVGTAYVLIHEHRRKLKITIIDGSDWLFKLFKQSSRRDSQFTGERKSACRDF